MTSFTILALLLATARCDGIIISSLVEKFQVTINRGNWNIWVVDSVLINKIYAETKTSTAIYNDVIIPAECFSFIKQVHNILLVQGLQLFNKGSFGIAMSAVPLPEKCALAQTVLTVTVVQLMLNHRWIITTNSINHTIWTKRYIGLENAYEIYDL